MGSKLSNIITTSNTATGETKEKIFVFPEKKELITCYKEKLGKSGKDYLAEKTIVYSGQITELAGGKRNMIGIDWATILALSDYTDYICKDAENDFAAKHQCKMVKMIEQSNLSSIKEALIRCSIKTEKPKNS